MTLYFWQVPGVYLLSQDPEGVGLNEDQQKVYDTLVENCDKMKTRLWHDDIRRPPDGSWLWARTNIEATRILVTQEIKEISMDHDLGLHEADPDVPDADMQMGMDEFNDGYDLVQVMCLLKIVPERITVHSWNPHGAQRMADRFRDYGHKVRVRQFVREIEGYNSIPDAAFE